MEEMPKIPYTLRRGRTYYFRLRVPDDLIAAYGGKTNIVKSLKTTNPSEASKRVE